MDPLVEDVHHHADAKVLDVVLREVELLLQRHVVRAERREDAAVVAVRLPRRVARRPRERCLLYTSPSPRDISGSRMPSSA